MATSPVIIPSQRINRLSVIITTVHHHPRYRHAKRAMAINDPYHSTESKNHAPPPSAPYTIRWNRYRKTTMATVCNVIFHSLAQCDLQLITSCSSGNNRWLGFLPISGNMAGCVLPWVMCPCQCTTQTKTPQSPLNTTQ